MNFVFNFVGTIKTSPQRHKAGLFLPSQALAAVSSIFLQKKHLSMEPSYTAVISRFSAQRQVIAYRTFGANIAIVEGHL